MSQSASRQHMQWTPRRNPVQTRPYLNLPHGTIHHQAHQSDSTPRMIEQAYQPIQENEQYIYGTNISQIQVMKQLEEFVMDFETIPNNYNNNRGNANDNEIDIQPQKIYRNQLNELDLDMIKSNIFQVEAAHIKQYNSELYNQFIYFPAQMISIFDTVLKYLYEQLFIRNDTSAARVSSKRAKKNMLMIGIKRLDEIKFMRYLTPMDINRLISFRGIVIRCSQIYPQMKRALFRCINQACLAQYQVILENAKVEEPTKCTHCRQKAGLQIMHNLCEFTDKQYIKFQQLPQYVPEGQTPNSLTIVCYDNNVNCMRPGDRVQIVGIYRSQQRKINSSRNAIHTQFSTYTDLISYKIIQQNRFKSTLGDTRTIFSQQDKNKFYQIADQQDPILQIVNSFAPSIYGNQTIKKGLLTQIFGGTVKQFEGRGRFRSDINICLVGDPSTAKSQMLKQVHKLAPRGVYTSGRGSSAVGLTANVRKDPETRQFVLQSGALVLSDLGICCIDEFDKMDENSKTILLQAMQQQTISIAKAGIVCQLNSRTSILSAANPIHSKYDAKKSVVQNINLPPALLSRFDLIYIMLDKPNEAYDRKLASHILNIYSTNPKKSSKKQVTIDRDIFSKYITYAKQYIHPKINEQAAKKLVNSYRQMRKVGNNRKTITATPRQLQSLIRISQSFAKMRLSSEVTEQDVDEAYHLIKQAIQQSATDHATGLIDMDVIVTGTSATHRKRIQKIKDLLLQIMKSNLSIYKQTSKVQVIKPELERHWNQKQNSDSQKPSQEQIVQSLRRLQAEGYINMFGQERKTKPSFKYLT